MRRIFRRAALLAALAVGTVALSSCAHRDLIAPCTRDSRMTFGAAYADDCGPMRPVNR
jgi:hypothetical protein